MALCPPLEAMLSFIPDCSPLPLNTAQYVPHITVCVEQELGWKDLQIHSSLVLEELFTCFTDSVAQLSSECHQTKAPPYLAQQRWYFVVTSGLLVVMYGAEGDNLLKSFQIRCLRS